jgi:rare lipoprotein A
MKLLTSSCRYILSSLLLASLIGCAGGENLRGPSGPSDGPVPYTGIKVGKPYKINGVWYHPRRDDNYDEIGVASWYGPGFHGRRTANGEIYNQYDITAAHPTLPMPSIVQVTNLENGKSLQLRINDRGPFHDGRIIDLSKASARKLGITGLAKVRVRYLKEATQAFMDSKGTLPLPITPQNMQQEAVRAMAAKEIAPPPQTAKKPATMPTIQRSSAPFRVATLARAENPRALSDRAPITTVSSRNLPAELPAKKPMPRHPAKSYRMVDDGKASEPFRSYQPGPSQGAISTREPLSAPAAPLRTAPVRNNVQPPPASAVHYGDRTIKVASYRERANAAAMMRQLKTLGEPAMEVVNIQGTLWYRVMLRPDGRENPSALLATLRQLGAHDAHLM